MLRYKIASPQFKSSLPPENVIFDHEIATDIKWLEATPIMHIVDTRMGFQNAVLLSGKISEALWMAFIECCATVYAGYSVTIRLDQESGSVAEALRNLDSAHGINLQFSGAQSHNSVGGGEIHHEQLRRYFHVLLFPYQNTDPELLLRYDRKLLNNTIRPYELLRSLLVISSLPTFPMLNNTLLGQEKRMQMTGIARNDIAEMKA